MLAEQIMDKGDAGMINLQGLAINNGCWGNQVGRYSVKHAFTQTHATRIHKLQMHTHARIYSCTHARTAIT